MLRKTNIRVFVNTGPYHELFECVLKNQERKGGQEEEKSKSLLIKFLVEEVGRATDLAKQKDELPVPDFAYFRALYYKYKKSNSPQDVDKISEDFMSAIQELVFQIEAAYNDK